MKGFVAQCNLRDKFYPPVRSYVHEAGINEVYDGKALNAQKYLEDFLKKIDPYHAVKDCEFILACIWGDVTNNGKMIDIFGLNGDYEAWPGNPTYSSWVIENGLFTHSNVITCSDTLILFAEEEKYRRTTKSLVDYMNAAPCLGITPLNEE